MPRRIGRSCFAATVSNTLRIRPATGASRRSTAPSSPRSSTTIIINPRCNTRTAASAAFTRTRPRPSTRFKRGFWKFPKRKNPLTFSSATRKPTRTDGERRTACLPTTSITSSPPRALRSFSAASRWRTSSAWPMSPISSPRSTAPRSWSCWARGRSISTPSG